MLFTDKVLFIHVPKTAGMSITRFMIDNMRGDVTISIPRGHSPGDPRIREIVGIRHERLHEAQTLLATLGRKLSDFELILSVMRNPYDLEVSYYFQKRKPLAWERGRAKELAMTGNFLEFVRRAPFNGRLPVRIEEWYQIDGKAPPNLRALRFENIERELCEAVGPLMPIEHKLGVRNAADHAPFREFLSPEVEEAIYRKYQWLFDSGFYPRELTGQLPE